MRLKTLFILGLLTVISGCSSLFQKEQIQGQGNATQWSQHKQQLQALDGWQISGKIGLRLPNPSDSGSGTLFWLQRQDYFDIRLAGPLGQGATRLTGRPDAVTLEIAGRGQLSADSPEALLQETLGWSLPVSHLFWWIRALPAPDSRSRIELNSDNRLAQLEQDGWRVEYSRYAEHQGYWLPERIKLYGTDVEVTLVIKEWQARQLGLNREPQ